MQMPPSGPMGSAKSKFLAGEQEPDVGDPGEGMEQDPADALSPKAQEILQRYASQGQIPTMDDLIGEGLAEDEAMAVLDLIDQVTEGPTEPMDGPMDMKQGVRPGV
jgi:hypothetical protein